MASVPWNFGWVEEKQILLTRAPYFKYTTKCIITSIKCIPNNSKFFIFDFQHKLLSFSPSWQTCLENLFTPLEQPLKMFKQLFDLIYCCYINCCYSIIIIIATGIRFLSQILFERKCIYEDIRIAEVEKVVIQALSSPYNSTAEPQEWN